MSGGTRVDPQAAARTLSAVGGKAIDKKDLDRIARLGMSPRQQRLNWLWSYYQAAQYEGRRIDWDGDEYVPPVEAEAIVSQSFVPPGMVDAGATMPLKFRRPSVQYHLARAVVHRFTGMLFSDGQSPGWQAPGDADTEDFCQALADASRLWSTMAEGRNYGGATGTCVLGFKFVDGRPVVEVFDPRWVRPFWKNRTTLTLSALEIRYHYPMEVLDEETGVVVEVPCWYRRIINETHDVTFKPEPVAEGDEPDWQLDPDQAVEHHLGFCPVVWIQNLPVLGDVDGEPDCHGAYEMFASIDTLLSQASRGTVLNCDPSLHVATDAEMPSVQKGSGVAIKTPAGGSVRYVEISGSGPQAAREMASELRGYALEVTQCVLDPPDAAAGATATEIRRRYSAMVSKAGMLREQYGERGARRLMNMMVRAVRRLQEGWLDEEGTRHVSTFDLPPRAVERDDGTVELRERKLGETKDVQLAWPNYFEATLDEAVKAVQAAGAAKAGGLVDDKHAVQFVAPYFKVENATEMLRELKEAGEQQQGGMFGGMFGGGGLPPPPQEEPPPEGEEPPPEQEGEGAPPPDLGGDQY